LYSLWGKTRSKPIEGARFGELRKSGWLSGELHATAPKKGKDAIENQKQRKRPTPGATPKKGPAERPAHVSQEQRRGGKTTQPKKL